MSAQSLLDQLLKSGGSMLGPLLKGGAPSGAAGAPAGGEGWGKFAGGAVAGSALGLLLGSKRGRSFGGKALQYGSVAALGAVAYRAYSQWQENQQQNQQTQHSGTATVAAPVQTVDRLPAPAAESHSRAMLLAMIAAAKADGHLDAREQDLVEAELNRLEADPALRQWYTGLLHRPLDPAEVAKAATTPEMASEVYLVSLLVVDQTSFMEKAYLDELARQLALPPALQTELQAQLQAKA
ncbi:MAG: tellurite resistance TerB family protein [Pseudomonadota bacterium]